MGRGYRRSMYQVLYRKWRPSTFSDVCGQPHITKALQNEIRQNRPAHAYLFIGSRGTGKTSCAKILAKAVNCLHPQDGNPCNECDNCRGIDDGSILDVEEIDAASNNGVDSIRDLREAVNFTPAVAKYRVYIIDEVHMLSDGAFNALLKTLEEPPPHVIFILATTEVHKLPATILSRCQRFDFARIAPEDIAARLQTVAHGEGFSLTEEAAMLLSRLSDGAMRDALSLTDQCLSRSREITVKTVAEATGLAGREHLYILSKAVRERDSGALLTEIDRLYNASQDMARLCVEWLEFYRELMLCKSVSKPERMIAATDGEISRLKAEAALYELPAVIHAMEVLQSACARLSGGGDRRLETEMAALKLCMPALDDSAEALLRRVDALENALRRLSAGLPASADTSALPKEAAPVHGSPDEKHETPSLHPHERTMHSGAAALSSSVPSGAPESGLSDPALTADRAGDASNGNKPPAENGAENAADTGEKPLDAWKDVLSCLRESCAPLYGVLEHSDASVSETHIIIYTDNPLFRELIKSSVNKAALLGAIAQVTGRRYRIGVRVRQPACEEEAEDPLAALLRRGEKGGIPVTRHT